MRERLGTVLEHVPVAQPELSAPLARERVLPAPSAKYLVWEAAAVTLVLVSLPLRTRVSALAAARPVQVQKTQAAPSSPGAAPELPNVLHV